MKKTILLSMLVVCSQSVTFAKHKGPISAKAQVRICKALYAKAEEACTESMCEDFKSETDENECIRDGDFYEGLQICVGDDVFPSLISNFNKKHVGANLNCDDVDL